MLSSLTRLTRNWWLVALRGTLAVILGAAAFVWPGITLEVLVLLFGAYAILAGISQITLGFRLRGLAGSLQARAETVSSPSR